MCVTCRCALCVFARYLLCVSKPNFVPQHLLTWNNRFHSRVTHWQVQVQQCNNWLQNISDRHQPYHTVLSCLLLSTQSAQFAHQNGIKSPHGVVSHVLQSHCMLEQPVQAHTTVRSKEAPLSVLQLIVSIRSCPLLHAMLHVSQSHWNNALNHCPVLSMSIACNVACGSEPLKQCTLGRLSKTNTS